MELLYMKKFFTENPFMLAIYIVLFTLLVFEWGI
jgi:predicted negative regulator of RcsB-dependent stress response